MVGKPIHVLLVEDSPEDVQVIQAVLSDGDGADFQVSYADWLSAGLKMLAQGGIDVVLLDLGLPDSQGLETLVKVRQQAPGVAIVVLTASDDERLVSQALQQGAQDYLVKGYMQVYPNLLQRSMRYAIERKHSDDRVQQGQAKTHDQAAAIAHLQQEVNALLKQLGKPPKYPA